MLSALIEQARAQAVTVNLLFALALVFGVIVAVAAQLYVALTYTSSSRVMRELTQTLEQLSGHVRGVEADNAVLRGKVRQLADRVDRALDVVVELVGGIGDLRQQVIDLGGDPIWEAPSNIWQVIGEKQPRQPRQANERQLYQLIGEHFNLDEIRELCADLGIIYELLSGDTRLAVAISLVDYAQRHNLVDRLVDLVMQKRPFLQKEN